MKYVSLYFFMKYASKQCINNYQIHFRPIRVAVLMTFEANKSVCLMSKLGCPILHALKINKHYF